MNLWAGVTEATPQSKKGMLGLTSGHWWELAGAHMGIPWNSPEHTRVTRKCVYMSPELNPQQHQ